MSLFYSWTADILDHNSGYTTEILKAVSFNIVCILFSVVFEVTRFDTLLENHNANQLPTLNLKANISQKDGPIAQPKEKYPKNANDYWTKGNQLNGRCKILAPIAQSVSVLVWYTLCYRFELHHCLHFGKENWLPLWSESETVVKYACEMRRLWNPRQTSLEV